MDYSRDINKHHVSRLTDHHLVEGTPFSTGEGAIAIVMTNPDKEDDKRSILLFAHIEDNTPTEKVWCTKSINADEEEEFTIFGSTPLNSEVALGDSITISNSTYNTWSNVVYFIGKESENYTEFVLQDIAEHVFVLGTKSLTEEQLKQLKALTDMNAADRIQELLEQDWSKLATIRMANGSSVLDIKSDPRDNDFVVEYLDLTLRRKITNFNFTLKMFKADGTESDLPKCTISGKTLDGCVVTVPAAFTDGFAKVKVTFSWNVNSDTITRSTSCVVSLTSWDDPVILVSTLDDYDTLASYGMMLSPSVADPTNFSGCRDLTADEMSSGVAAKVLFNKGFITANTNKVNYLTGLGVSSADATALAKTFMTLSEAKAVTSGALGTAFKETIIDTADLGKGSYNALISTAADPLSLTHFESYAYFINVKNPADDAFRYCLSLASILLPLNIESISILMFGDCISLTTVKSLKD